MGDLERIRKRLDALRARVATALVVDGSARVAGALLGVVGASFLLDRVFKLEAVARAVLLLAGLAGLGWVVWRFLVRRLGAMPGEDPLAIAVERRFPELGDRLISALQLARVEDPEKHGMSPQLIEEAIHEALEPVRAVKFEAVIAAGRVFRLAALGALALGLLGAGAAADPESAGIWFQRNVLLRDVRWPQKTYLEVDRARFPDGVARVVRGDDLVVIARSVGEEHPERVTIFFRDSENNRGKATMKADRESRQYRHEFPDIAFPITFHLEGGDEVTGEYHIELMEPPEVSSYTLTVGFPAYAGREPAPIDLATGDPEMLRGGSITLEGVATKPLVSAALVFGEGEESDADVELTGERSFRVTFAPVETTLVGVRLRDRDGLSNPSLAPRFLVRVVEDRAPRVRLRKDGIGNMVVEGAVFPWIVRIRDDVKAVSGRLEVTKQAGDREAPEPVVVPLPDGEMGGDAFEIRGELEISSLEASPGAFLTFHAYAKDNAEPDAHEGKSDPVTVKVVTLEEMFSELLRRQQEQRRLFEELIQKEKRLRDRFRDLRDAPPSDPTERRIRMESQAQQQREIARRVRAIERAMEQILLEMANNRLYDPSRIDELRRKVVRGLENLREDVMGAHAETLDGAAKRAERLDLAGADGTHVDEGYARVIQAMEAVLARMVKVEGFTEIIERVRGILKFHAEVKEETRRRYEKGLREIFEEDD